MNDLHSIPLSKIKAVIFDMDELMVDSASVHEKIFEKVLSKYGISFNDLSQEENASWYGKRIIDLFVYFHKRYNLGNKTTPEKMNGEFNEMMLPIFGEKVRVMPGVKELIIVLRGKYRLAIASSAKRAKIDIVLQKLAATNDFSVIVSGEDDIQNGKPAPDIYLKTAQKLNVQPQECLVLEDAKNGVEAAKAAGMFCVGVHNKFTYERVGLRQDLSSADVQVDSLLEVIRIFQT